LNVLNQYVTSAPSAQNALDILAGSWVSKLPDPLAGLQAGPVPVFDDPRPPWAAEQLGDFKGRTVLELGSLEGGHTYQIERLGAAAILAIEANTSAYLRSLIIKELLEIRRARFVCGDFVAFLRENRKTFDVCFASGVLYHMRNPAELIALIAGATDRVLL
jgi:SAM-dependent methyltransferase